ncbi:DUF5348 domain-containing protein [Paenibacillus peoriae]|uniref:DUF5348 domain-containing protein n=1 Tax=Paenibacillus peoriae TaxID=59893 RepID=UPI002116492A|nr:DUF5348 domain-containing protein [Paenibacillus peoriae]
MTLKASEIHVGKQYVLVESPFNAAVVKVIEDQSGENSGLGRSKQWVGWRVRVEKNIGGIEHPIGHEFNCGWDEEYSHYSSLAFYTYDDSAKGQIREELDKLLPQIKKVTHMITDAEESWTDHYNRNDPEDLYLRSMFYRIGDMLDDANRLLVQTFAEVVDEGELIKQPNGRYSLHGRELTSGEPIEYLATDDDGDRWVLSRIGHNGQDYCLETDRNFSLEELRIRIKYIPR